MTSDFAGGEIVIEGTTSFLQCFVARQDTNVSTDKMSRKARDQCAEAAGSFHSHPSVTYVNIVQSVLHADRFYVIVRLFCSLRSPQLSLRTRKCGPVLELVYSSVYMLSYTSILPPNRNDWLHHRHLGVIISCRV